MSVWIIHRRLGGPAGYEALVVRLRAISRSHLSLAFADYAMAEPIGLLAKSHRELAAEVGMSPELLERLRVTLKFFVEEFESDVASEVDVLGFIHHAHAAAAEPADDPVMGDCLAVQNCSLGIRHTY